VKTVGDILRPPTEADVERALAIFASEVARHYGQRLIGIHLFGSRARGDHRSDSDADVAAVLEDGDWRYWTAVRVLSGLTYDRLIEEGCDIQAVPIAASEWWTLDAGRRPACIANLKRDARPLWSRACATP
jgi:predicted nucleotidyltransferase